MKNIKKILVFAMAMLLVMAISVGGTLAWLNVKTEPLKNTFVTGSKLAIKLDEAKVFEQKDQGEGSNVTDDMLGQVNTANPSRTTEGNEYKLVPGKRYDKDPKVTIEEDSEDCYVFVKVVNTLAGIEIKDDPATTDVDESAGKTIEAQMTANGWKKLSDAGVINAPNVWYYAPGRVAAGAELPVFQEFTIDKGADVSVTVPDVTIQAYAVQAETIADPVAAWNASPLAIWQSN